MAYKKEIMPYLKENKYSEYNILLEKLKSVEEDHLVIILDGLRRHQISGYITHVLRPFIATTNNILVDIIVKDDSLRDDYIKSAETALDKNFIRYDYIKGLKLGNYEFKRKNKTGKQTG